MLEGWKYGWKNEYMVGRIKKICWKDENMVGRMNIWLEGWIYGWYSGRRLYQYNEDDFLI